MKVKEIIRIIYLYLFSLIGLILLIIGFIKIIDLGLKTFIFKKADQVIIYPQSVVDIDNQSISDKEKKELILKQQEEIKKKQVEFETKQKEIEKHKTASNALALIIVGLPLFFYHWNLIKKDKNS